MKDFIIKEVEQDHAELLIEFIKTFEASTDPTFWTKLVLEEAREVLNAFENEGPAEQLKELADLRYVMIGFTVVRSPLFSILAPQEAVDNMEMASELVERIPRYMEEAGPHMTLENLESALRLVHKSNMSKLGPDGEVLRREDGKVLKGPYYVEPDLTGLVEASAA